jgi:uncharacterized protein (TIGR02147 family)
MTNVFDYSDYRRYLKDWVAEAKSAKTSNLGRLAEVAQVHATFLSQVISGSKDLSLEQATLISEHLQFTSLEREFFFVLIQLERAGNHKLKDYWKEKKRDLEAQKNRLGQRFDAHKELSAEERAVFYSSWLYSAIRVSSDIGKGITLEEVATNFRIPREKAEELLVFLTSTGLCEEKNGRYKMGEQHVHVPNESPLVVRHHTNWRLQALQSMERRERDELFFTAPMSISAADFAVIREKLNVLIKETVGIAKDSKAEQLVCFSMDFYRPKP